MSHKEFNELNEDTIKQLIDALSWSNEKIFESRKPSHIIKRIKELENRVHMEEGVQIDRTFFSDTNMGEMAYQAITAGSKCQLILDEEKSDRTCNARAIMSVEFDHAGDYTMLLACSLDHEKGIEKGVSANLAVENRVTMFGINGFGRHK